MADRFINLATGSDAADGLTRANAKKTLNASSAGWTAGDVVYVAGTSSTADSHPAVSKTINNLTIKQDPDQAQAIFDGASTTGAWTANGDGTYNCTIASGLGAGKVAAVTGNWRTSTNSRGSHYGTLTRMASDAAVVTLAGGAGTAGGFFYTTGTGVIKEYFGGTNPSTLTTDYFARDTTIALELVGTGNIVDGIWFYRWNNEGQGACVWLKDGTGSSTITNCKSWDCGPHAFICSGQTVVMANASITNCSSDGAKFNAAHFTFFQANGFGTTSNLTISGCTVERHNYFNIDQTEIVTIAGASNPCGQNGFYCHADAGTPIGGVTYSGCTSYDQSVVNASIADAGGSAAPADATLYTSYQVKIDSCNFQNMSRWITTDHIAARKTVFGLQRSGASLLCAYGGFGCISNTTAASKVYCESCPFTYDSDGTAGGGTMGVALQTANVAYLFVNCSFCDLTDTPSAAQLQLFAFQAVTTCSVTCIGCIFSNATDTTDTQALCYGEAPTTAAQFTRTDCAYGIFSHYGIGGGFSFADPLTADTTGINIGATINPFTRSATDLNIVSGSALYGRKRATSTVTPAAGIDGPYQGYYGAYQNQDSTGARSRGASDPGRMAWRNR